MEVIWSSLAQKSFIEILAYIEAYFGSTISRRVRRDIDSYIRTLARNPHLGRIFTHRPDGNYIRVLLYKGNRIYYQVFDTHIKIIIIWDGRRDPNKLRDLLNGYFDIV